MEEAVLKELYNKAGRREHVTITIPAVCAINARTGLTHLAGGAELLDAAAFKGALNEFDIGLERGVDLKEYLDTAIQVWWEKKKAARHDSELGIAQAYIAAFQSVRLTIFGESLKEDT